jgi:hypothetical protein
MLIFDQFPTRKRAEDFAGHLRDTFGRATRVCDSQEESNKHDPFPFELQPPIVLVERDVEIGSKLESKIERLVAQFDGAFAGT